MATLTHAALPFDGVFGFGVEGFAEGSSVGPGLFGGVHHHACNMQFSVEDFRRAQEASSCVLPFVSPFPFMNLLHFLTSSVHAPELTVI